MRHMATQITPPGPPVTSSPMAQHTLRRIKPRKWTTDQFRWPSQEWIQRYVGQGGAAHQHDPSQHTVSHAHDGNQVNPMDIHAEGEPEEATQVDPLPPSEASTGISLPNQVLLVLFHLQSFLAFCPLHTVARLAWTCRMIQEPSVAAHLASRTQTLHQLWIILQKRGSRQQQKKHGIVAHRRSAAGVNGRANTQVRAQDISPANPGTGDISWAPYLDAANGNPIYHLEHRTRIFRSSTVEDIMNHGNYRKIIRQHRRHEARLGHPQPLIEQEEQPRLHHTNSHNWSDGEAVSRWQEIMVEATENLGLSDVTSRSEAGSADEMETTVELHRMDQYQHQMETAQQQRTTTSGSTPSGAPDTLQVPSADDGDHGGGRKGKSRRRPKTTGQRQAELAVLDDIRLDKAIDESLLEMAMEKSLTEPHESHLLDMAVRMSLAEPAIDALGSNLEGPSGYKCPRTELPSVQEENETLASPDLPPVRPPLGDPPQPASCSNEDWKGCIQRWRANGELPSWIPTKSEQTFRNQADQTTSSSQAPRGGSSATAGNTFNMCMHCETQPGTDWPLGLLCSKCYAELSVWLSEN